MFWFSTKVRVRAGRAAAVVLDVAVGFFNTVFVFICEVWVLLDDPASASAGLSSGVQQLPELTCSTSADNGQLDSTPWQEGSCSSMTHADSDSGSSFVDFNAGVSLADLDSKFEEGKLESVWLP